MGTTKAKPRTTRVCKTNTGRGCAPLPEYNMEIVGDDKRQAVAIRNQIRKGIEAAADICRMRPPVCRDNLGITRDRMPQITGDANVIELLESADKLDRAKGRAVLAAGGKKNDTRTVQDQLLDFLESKGIRTRRRRVRVGTLKATQSEIKASKAYGMADSHLRGDFPTIDKQIVISRDGYILDGHHRWAALLTIDPGRFMSVLEVGLPMAQGDGATLLGEAAAFPGVYQATFRGDPLPSASQKKYKRENSSKLGGAKNRRRVVARKPRATKASAADSRRALSRAVSELL